LPDRHPFSRIIFDDDFVWIQLKTSQLCSIIRYSESISYSELIFWHFINRYCKIQGISASGDPLNKKRKKNFSFGVSEIYLKRELFSLMVLLFTKTVPKRNYWVERSFEVFVLERLEVDCKKSQINYECLLHEFDLA